VPSCLCAEILHESTYSKAIKCKKNNPQTQNPMSVQNVHHIAIIGSDYERSKDFYIRVLGMTLLAEHYREARQSWKADLAVGDKYQIELFTFPGAPERPSRPEAQGLRHIAFGVADLGAEVARISALGIEVEPIRVDEFTEKRFTFLADPDDLPIELYEI
jgi:glyoxylase I family protein